MAQNLVALSGGRWLRGSTEAPPLDPPLERGTAIGDSWVPSPTEPPNRTGIVARLLRWARRCCSSAGNLLFPTAGCPRCGAPVDGFADLLWGDEARFLTSVQFRCRVCERVWRHTSGWGSWEL